MSMEQIREIIELKEEIEEKREKLNKVVLDSKGKDEILRFSQELDILITKYTSYMTKKDGNSRT